MNTLDSLLQDILSVKQTYDKQRDKERFNIFYALHKPNDEVSLHSRFISYLLAPNSRHGMNDVFAKIFIRDILKISENEFNMKNYEVIPNEFNKTEYKEIDILIYNKINQAIIIENKIYAPPSNHPFAKEGYKGQIERYVNTIKSGIDKDGKSGIKCENVKIYYLSLKNPLLDELERDNSEIFHEIKYLNYENEIVKWLEIIIKEISTNNQILKEVINQYLKLVKIMTNTVIDEDEKKALKQQIAKNIESSEYLINNFKHVKWHTVYDFWEKLKEMLQNTFKLEKIELYSDNIDFIEAIGKITHENKDINHGVKCYFSDGKIIYISGLGNLTWGILEPNIGKKWKEFENEKLQNICFSSFSNVNTFRFINAKEMTENVALIVQEIVEEKAVNFYNMNVK